MRNSSLLIRESLQARYLWIFAFCFATVSSMCGQLNQSKPKPQIFWEFIDAERHNIIHEYVVGAGQGVTVHVGQNKPTEHHYLVNTGPFAGRDQRDILREAITWCEAYLDGIDQEATQ